MPTCLSHFSVLNASSLGAFQMLSPSDGHGPVHIQTGGMYGPCGDAYKAFVTKWADVLNEDMTTEQVCTRPVPGAGARLVCHSHAPLAPHVRDRWRRTASTPRRGATA